MRYIITVSRQERGSDERYTQSFYYEPKDGGDTVATALSAINERETPTDINGKPARRIEWECGCLQKKCGTCAMIVCGRPRLACEARLSDLSEEIVLKPLRKFPVVCDLVVDRSILFRNLGNMRLWPPDEPERSGGYGEIAFESSECLQCGCCLDVCPDFRAGGGFFGMSVVPTAARLLAETPEAERKELLKRFKEHFSDGCVRCFACKNVCPKHIDIEKMLACCGGLAGGKREK